MLPEDLRQTGVVVMQAINISVKNKSGEDLLDPANANGIKKFKIYYLVNGEKKLYFNSYMDAPLGYRIWKFPAKEFYYLNVLMDGGIGIHETQTFLQLGDSPALDTLKAQYRTDPTNIIAEKVWHNDQLVWKMEDGEPAFEIIIP
ncbi:hypothetical protein FEM33_24000 [Dyadobacter flavalbus]|uniref:Uncharacterized protein n=1 Tax=Dyadobacter flavalbus TaxID=2579942 RepID=A0A5M8Q9W5_9BACT|nr:hypothetical protein [Dyadobacter flavalbus]KAA6432777.1 hypothetical protein FEM33_24000 [Dyadobacter flavalbus]